MMSTLFSYRFLLGLALALLALAPAGQAQVPERNQREVDSLRRVVARHPRDTHGTKAMVSLMYNFLYNDTAQAGSYGRQAVRVAQAIGDERRLARAYYNLATLAAMQGHFEESVRRHLLSARYFLALGNPLWAGHNYANAGSRLSGIGRFEEAMQLNLRGLRLREAAHDTAAVADSYGNIGQLYLEQQNLPAAQQAYEESLRGWRRMKVTPYIVSCLNHLAIIHRDAGRLPQARAYVAQGLAEARADSGATASLLLTLAVAEQHQGRWAAALPLLRRVEAEYQRQPPGHVTPQGFADLYAIIGESLVKTGQLTQARPYLRQALAQARRNARSSRAVAGHRWRSSRLVAASPSATRDGGRPPAGSAGQRP